MNAQLRGKKPTHTHTDTHTGADPLNRVCAARRWTQRPLSSSVRPGTGLLVCGYPRLQWPHQDQTSDMTNVLTHSFLPAHNFWSTGESVPINQAQNVLYCGNYQWRS